MIKPIVKDTFFLSQKSAPATRDDLQVGRDLQDTLEANRAGCVGMAANMIGDLQVGRDLQDTLEANRAGCVGMAANMIGVRKRVIIVNMGILDIVMFNPVLVKKDTPYETEEGCLSLTGVRSTTRYQNIEVEYYDMNWKKQRQKLSGWTAQICQHELDHLEGILI